MGIALMLLRKYWKDALFFIVIALAALAVKLVVDHIEEIGYKKGYTKGFADEKVVLDKVLAQQAADNLALNNKIKGLEDASHVAAANEFALRAKLQEKVDNAVTDYVKAEPKSSQECSLDTLGVHAINQMLEADPAIITPEAK